MTDKKPTPAQIRALKFAAGGDLYRRESAHGLLYGSAFSSDGHRVHVRTVWACVPRWLSYGQSEDGVCPLVLTQDGKAALARWGGPS